MKVKRVVFMLIAIVADSVAGVAFSMLSPHGISTYLWGLTLWAPTGMLFYLACRKEGIPITTGYLAFSVGTTLTNWLAGQLFLGQYITLIEKFGLGLGIPALLLAITSTSEGTSEVAEGKAESSLYSATTAALAWALVTLVWLPLTLAYALTDVAAYALCERADRSKNAWWVKLLLYGFAFAPAGLMFGLVLQNTSLLTTTLVTHVASALLAPVADRGLYGSKVSVWRIVTSFGMGVPAILLLRFAIGS